MSFCFHTQTTTRCRTHPYTRLQPTYTLSLPASIPQGADEQTLFPNQVNDLFFLCCHTAPNERLLQLFWQSNLPVVKKSSYPSKRKASTTCEAQSGGGSRCVVIPFQTKGFYNCQRLQLDQRSVVVIPFQTKGFYNPDNGMSSYRLLVVIPLRMNGFYN